MGKINRLLNTRIRDLSGLTIWVDEENDESVFRWFAILREWEMIALLKKVYVREYVRSRFVG